MVKKEFINNLKNIPGWEEKQVLSLLIIFLNLWIFIIKLKNLLF